MILQLPVKAQKIITPEHPDIIYWGRVDFTNAEMPAFEHAGVTIRARFTGSSIKATFNDFAIHGPTTTNYMYAIVDENTPIKVELLKGTNTYTFATGLSDGAHTLQIVKLTEANVGRVAFLGFQLDDKGQLQSLEDEPQCHIEFIGNSITCGYGNEVSIPAPPQGNPTSGFTSVNENNYWAWGYITSRNLGMKYSAVSYSGRGLYRNNSGLMEGTLPKIYSKIFPDDAKSPLWNHAAVHPDYIVIDLGTNDFFTDPANPLSQQSFESTYVDFVRELKQYHPAATVILAVGVMMSDGYPSGAQQWTRIRTYVKNAVNTLTYSGLNNIYYFEMAPQSPPYGEDWHPARHTHQRMADELTIFIKAHSKTCSSTLGSQNKDSGLESISIYPNPAGTILNIRYPGKENDWMIVSENGKEIIKGKGHVADISTLKTGTYFVKMQHHSFKFIKN